MSTPSRRVRVLLVGAMLLASMVPGCGDEQAVTTGGTSGGISEPRLPTCEEAALRRSAIRNDGVGELSEAGMESCRRLEASVGGYDAAAVCENYRRPSYWDQMQQTGPLSMAGAAAACPHLLDEVALAFVEGFDWLEGWPGEPTRQEMLEGIRAEFAEYDALADQAVDL